MTDKPRSARAPVGVQRRAFPITQFKAVDGAERGTFEAIVSVFGNIDSYGERMVKGAFERTLSERGLPPIYWNHDWRAGPIGDPIEAEERDEGLWVKGQLYTDAGSDLVERIYRQMLGPAKTEFSFAFRVKNGRWVTEDEDEIYEITEVELYEVGPVTVGANPETELLEVASGALIRAGGEPEAVQNAHDRLVAAGARCGAKGAEAPAAPPNPAETGDIAATLRALALLTKRQYEEA